MIVNDFILGFMVGGVFVLGSTFICAMFLSKVARLPSPLTGQVYQPGMTEALPIVLTNEKHEGKIEREYFDQVPGLGR